MLVHYESFRFHHPPARGKGRHSNEWVSLGSSLSEAIQSVDAAVSNGQLSSVGCQDLSGL
jgi:hypothetical protein